MYCSHPDKVKLAVNQTMEAVEAKFVEITKAYKSCVHSRYLSAYINWSSSLTDENIRKNWELYGHPDGRQEVSMGIALPKWIIESNNNIWVLGAYGLIFGGALPALVVRIASTVPPSHILTLAQGRWWFGNRRKTKDGVHARSAAAFFKNLTEESGIDDVTGSLGKTFEWELPASKVRKADAELAQLEKQIKEKLEDKWDELVKLTEAAPGKLKKRRRAFTLLYAHLLRLPVSNTTLQNGETECLVLHRLILIDTS